ncbi:MAG: hypothetical protein KA369_17185 [Spirochaetes bacterium]|nr:hypothetical protein [Spirochaetota bacterium]
MKDVMNMIIDVEKECADRIAAAREEHDRAMAGLSERIEAEMKEEKKRVAGENGERRKDEIESAEKGIRRDLSSMKESLGGLHENGELRDEVRQRIISIIFQ